MAIARVTKREDGKEPFVVEPTKRKKVKKKRLSKKTPKFKCEKCKDTGVLKIDGLDVKCTCVVKQELKLWLDPKLATTIRRQGMLNLGVIGKKTTLEESINTIFRGIKLPSFFKLINHTLLREYYRRGMRTFNYALITGNDYTEDYVIGNHRKYERVEYLFLILGFDNFNQTLKTTIYSTIAYRLMNGLNTWIYVPKDADKSASFIDLYGEQLVKYIEDKHNFEVEVSYDSTKSLKVERVK